MRKVVIEVSGGVAYVLSCPDDVEVEIIDRDNEEAELEARQGEVLFNTKIW
jgi:hypothetical protein